MISLKDVSMFFGPKLLFNDVSLQLKPGNRYGLVGANGSGKSTLLKLLAGEEEANEGRINIAKNLTLSTLKQDHFKYENEQVINVVLMGHKPLWKAISAKNEILVKDSISDEDGMRLAELEMDIGDNDGYEAEGNAQILLEGLGVEAKYHFGPLSSLSGGFKLRVLLAQSLFADPDILLLDEPNNHLDIASIRWLEDYLKKYKGILVITSHDQEFLNNVNTHIMDIDYGEVRVYTGNYKKFCREKTEIVERKLKEKSTLDKRVAELQKFVDRFGAKATKAKQAKSKAKMIAKIILPDLDNTNRRVPKFNITQKSKANKIVLKTTDLAKSYADKQLFNKVSFKLERGEKIAVIGRNGVGKSSFLKSLLGIVKQDSGEIEWGSEAKISYFAQDVHEMLKDNKTALEWLEFETSGKTEQVLRSTLSAVLLGKDDVNKRISVLSGGECARLLFARMILEQPNVIVLDEPTNHLDIESRQALSEAIEKYEGASIIVSHDRKFISRIANRIVFIYEKGVIDFEGKYKDFTEKYAKLL